jgi:sensor histidine kinase regulating citrate/malate metabolism
LYTELGLLKQILLSLDSHDLGLLVVVVVVVVFLLTSQSNVHHKESAQQQEENKDLELSSKCSTHVPREEEVVTTRSSWRGRADTYIPTEQQQTNFNSKK